MADVVAGTGPSEIHRADQVRVAVVSSNLRDIDLGTAVQEVRSMVAADPLGADVGLHIGGQGEELDSSVRSLLFAFGLAVFLVYLVMASQFESLLHPFVILFTIPLALVGAVLALMLTGSPISVVVFIGLILLVGLVVKNAIILIDKVNQLREGGVPKREALVEGARSRLRPIVMTTLCTLFGFLPLALAFGEGAEVRSPMAITVIGGLLVSTLLTLVVIPVVYDLLDRRSDEYYAERARRARAEAAAAADLISHDQDPLTDGGLDGRRPRMSIAELSIKRPVTAIMLFVSMVVIGVIAAVRLPLEAMPDVSAPLLFVQIPYAGSTPEEVERNILRPIEETLSTMTDIKSMRGTAASESASVFMIFSDWDRDIEIAAAEARERIDAIRSELPDDLQRYFVWKWTTSDEPALELRLTSANLDLTREYDRIERNFKRRLERIPGVAKVELEGAPRNEVEIAINQDRLNAHGLNLNTLTTRLRAVNFSVSAGQIDDGGRRLRVQPIGELTDLQQLRDLVLDDGVRLADVADVRLKPERMPYGRRLDGRPAIGIDIYKERNANLVEVSRTVLAEVEVIRKDPANSDVRVEVTDNQGENVTKSLIGLAEAGGIGLLLSIVVLYFFLRHWPSTLMVTLAIPICFTMTLGFMYFAGVTLNVLTMMGLLLAIGMLVDNAVVVVESIYQEREKNAGQPKLASIVGTRHVAIALSAGTLCHCIVFVPNMFGERNMISIYMAQIAITICVSLLASWLVAVSLIPMLSARMKTPPAVKNERRRDRAHATPLRGLPALDAGASRRQRARHPADHRGQLHPRHADQDQHVRWRRSAARSTCTTSGRAPTPRSRCRTRSSRSRNTSMRTASASGSTRCSRAIASRAGPRPRSRSTPRTSPR